MPYLNKYAVPGLVSSLATCGGDAFMLFDVAEAIQKHGEGELWRVVPTNLSPMAKNSLAELEAEVINGEITPLSVLRRFGSPKHFQAMNEQAKKGMRSIADNIPADIRPIAHTLLPVTPIEGGWVYANGGRYVTLKGLVPLGPQEGNLVVHLAGVFNSSCSRKEIEKLLQEQEENDEMMAMADRVGTIDYSGTNLQKVTIGAKEALNLTDR